MRTASASAHASNSARSAVVCGALRSANAVLLRGLNLANASTRQFGSPALYRITYERPANRTRISAGCSSATVALIDRALRLLLLRDARGCAR